MRRLWPSGRCSCRACASWSDDPCEKLSQVRNGNGPTSRETASISSDATGDRAKVVGEAEGLQEPYTQREGA